MTNAAVAEAPAKPADSQDANPAPDSQAPASPDATNVNAGTDQEQPTQATSQTAPAPDAKPAEEVKPTEASKPADTRSEAEIRADERNRLAAEEQERTRQADLKRVNEEVRKLRQEGGKTVRSMIKKIQEHVGTILPDELTEPLENWVETMNGKSLEAVRLMDGDAAEQRESDINREFVQGILDAVPQDKRDALYAESRGKDHATWIKNALKYAPQPEGSVTVPALIEEANAWGEDAATALNDTEKAELAKEVKGLKSAKAVIRTVAKYAAIKENRAPGGAPSGGERGPTHDLDYQAYLRLPEAQKAAFNRDNPDKFAAFLGMKRS